ncbi:hypothetical protein GCM10017687_42390 [Streptomyces echinatus]
MRAESESWPHSRHRCGRRAEPSWGVPLCRPSAVPAPALAAHGALRPFPAVEVRTRSVVPYLFRKRPEHGRRRGERGSVTELRIHAEWGTAAEPRVALERLQGDHRLVVLR